MPVVAQMHGGRVAGGGGGDGGRERTGGVVADGDLLEEGIELEKLLVGGLLGEVLDLVSGGLEIGLSRCGAVRGAAGGWRGEGGCRAGTAVGQAYRHSASWGLGSLEGRGTKSSTSRLVCGSFYTYRVQEHSSSRRTKGPQKRAMRWMGEGKREQGVVGDKTTRMDAKTLRSLSGHPHTRTRTAKTLPAGIGGTQMSGAARRPPSSTPS
jgi:hypothetical protein